MGLIATGKSEKRELPPEGLHLAICYGLYDLGSHWKEWKGQRKLRRLVLFQWELHCDEKTKDNRPFAISQEYTLSLGEKANLRKDLESWRGRKFTEQELEGFDLKNVLGKACMIQVVHTAKGDNTYANVQTVTSKPKQIQEPVCVNAKKFFAFDGTDMPMPEGTPEWIQKKIMASQEFLEATGQDQSGEDQSGESDGQENDVPF